MIYLVFLLWLAQAAIYNSSLYNVGSNLIYNGDFSYPTVPVGQTFRTYSFGVGGWNCSSQIQIVDIQRMCTAFSRICNVSFIQCAEWDTQTGIDQHIFQNVTVTNTGEYYLKIIWMPSIFSPIGKGFEIYLNTTLIAQLIATDSLYEDHVFEMLVNLTAGTLFLDMVEISPLNDFQGAFIGSIELTELLPINT
jgi:hypothetical protein